MKIRNIVVTGVITVFAGVVSAGAMHGIHGKMSCHSADKAEMIIEHMTKELDLTSEQQENVKQIMDSVHSILKSKKSIAEETHRTLFESFKNNTITEQQIVDIWYNHRAQADEVVPLIAKQLMQFNGILTNEQRQKMAEKIESCHGNGLHGLFLER